MTAPWSYASPATPGGYSCGPCGASGCKLWREYNVFLDHQTLRCAPCALRSQGRPAGDPDPEGRVWSEDACRRTDQIGWLVPAVPTEENDTFWGYTSVPLEGVRWWRALPSVPGRGPNQCDGCRAGRPVDADGRHRMGDGEYPDMMICQRPRYAGGDG